ncbi:MAG: hypothetical protein JXA18_08920 [Chitinispirillaceae bacterium]|nr:hypothetical protein [Chitinispirillaceae bacterium]
MKSTGIFRRLLIAVCILAALMCTNPPTAGNSSQTPNSVVGMIYQSNGKTPAAGVRVAIRPRNTLADTSGLGLTKQLVDTATVMTDDSGRFVFDSTLDTGTYVIEADDGDGNMALVDSVQVGKSDSAVKVEETLRPAGAIKGIIRLSEGGDPRKVFVLAFGIDRFARVEVDGSFRFTNLAEGIYDLRLISSLADYGVLDINGVPVSAGDTTNLDTLVLPFVGLPSPKNISVSYDTLNQTVIVSWDTISTSLIDGFNVYRAIKGNNFVLLTDTPLPETTTVFLDSSVKINTTYEYRVVSRNSAGEESKLVDIIEDTVTSVSFTEATTTIEWKTIGTKDSAVSINDTIRIIAAYANPTRVNDKIQWYIDTTDSSIRTVDISSLSGSDTLVYCWQDTGEVAVIINIVDEAESEWMDSLHISIVRDAPVVGILGESTVAINTPITFTAQVSQEFGTITKYLWDNGIDPGWDDSTGSDYTFTFFAVTTVTMTLEVTDDDGNIEFATKKVVVTNDAPVVTGLEDTTISINDTIHFSIDATDNNGIKTIFWDFGDGSGTQYDTTTSFSNYHIFPDEPMQCGVTVTVVDSFDKPTVSTANVDVILDPSNARIHSPASIHADSTLVLSADQCTPGRFGSITKYEWSIGSYTDFATSSGDTVITPPFGDEISLVVVLKITDDDNNISLDTTKIIIGPSWTRATAAAPFPERLGHAVTTFNNRLWVIGGANEATQNYNYNDVWSSEDGIDWTLVNNAADFTPRNRHSITVFQNKMWLIGGFVRDAEGDRFRAINDVWWSEDGVDWTEATAEAAFSPRYSFGTVVFDNKIWILGAGGFGPSDVWWSRDGIAWTEATSEAPFKPTAGLGFSVFEGKIWAMGGHDEEHLNHVWNSNDGYSWTLVTDSADFSERGQHATAVLENILFLLGGRGAGENELNDVWCSFNGNKWIQTKSSTRFEPRAGFGITVFNNKLWVIGGSVEDGAKNDVWYAP